MKALLLWIGLCYLAAGIGALLTAPGLPEWYASLPKPSWTPPAWLFGPVWTILYTMMGVAAWLVWRQGGWSAQAWPLGLFLLQLGLNVAWSGLFFGLRRPDLALLDVFALELAILATAARFWPISTPAGLLLLPYLAWVGFAAALNLAIVRGVGQP